MAASVFGGSPGHHNRIIHNSVSSQMMADGLSSHQQIPSFYQNNKQSSSLASLKHSTALSSVSVNPIKPNILFAQTPPPFVTSYIATPQQTDIQHALPNQQFNSLPTFAPTTQHCQVPPELPKKMRSKLYRPSNSGTLPPPTLSSHVDKHHLCNTKRKSAVELLAESKAYYVKSEVVLDRKQKLSYQNKRTLTGGRMSGQISPPHTFPHQRAYTLNNRRTASANSELLQMKLRRLINDPAASKESNSYTNSISCKDNYYRRPIYDLEDMKFEPPKQFSSNKRLTQELTIHPVTDPNIDTAVMFPSAFLSPQSLPPHNTISDDEMYDDYCDDKNSSILMSEYQPISPPAEYAEFNNSSMQHQLTKQEYRYNNYQRSYSHSQTADIEESDYITSPTHNTNSHKSLPDLHAQTNRNSPYSEALSQCSRGNRSNKSNSSLNRDSGGSSGHYTHRSEPYWQQQQSKHLSPHIKPYSNIQKRSASENRRDSGSSTQHSSNSHYDRGSMGIDRLDCDDQSYLDAHCLLNFTTSEVPEAFQDHFSDNESDKQKQNYLNEPNTRSTFYSKGVFDAANPHEPHQRDPAESELSPPLGTFKRQRCLRLKQHPTRHPSPSERSNDVGCDDRKPILRSKSDISHRYWSRNTLLKDSGPSDENMQLHEGRRCKSDNVFELEQFFDRLGLAENTYDEFIANKFCDSASSSPVFFSDVSTVDSNRLPDSTETQIVTQPYRPMEPTSIVERNARIIKWLCTCRKMQIT